MKLSKLFHTVLILFFGIAVNKPAWAQLGLNDTIAFDEIVITGSKQYRSAGNVTQKIDVIRSIEFESAVTGKNNIAELISRKPGSSVSALSRNDANWGTYAGIGPKYSTFMLNGLPLDAFVDPMSLDILAFERIEIQRGPASVLYPNYLSHDFAGSQSPLAGTVNLILKENIADRETHLLTSYGSYNTLNTQFYHQDTRDNMNFFGGVNYENSDYTNYGTENSWLNMQKDPEYRKLKLFSGENVIRDNYKNIMLLPNDNDRKVIGSINDCVFRIKYYGTHRVGTLTDANQYIGQHLNETPMGAIDYKYPKDLMRERINQVYHQKDRGR